MYTTIHTFRTALQRLYTIVQQLYKLFILSHNFYKSLQSLTTSFYKTKYRTLQNVEQIYTFKHKTFQNLTTLHTNCTKNVQNVQNFTNCRQFCRTSHTTIHNLYTKVYTAQFLQHFNKMSFESLHKTFFFKKSTKHKNTILFTKLYKTFGF